MRHGDFIERHEFEHGVRLVREPVSGPLANWMTADDVAPRIAHTRSGLRYTTDVAVLSHLTRTENTLVVAWTTVPYEVVRTAHTWPELAGGICVSLEARIHVTVADGYVATRRSTLVANDHQHWQSAVAEGIEPDDLAGDMFDPALCGRRGMREELGVTCTSESFSLDALSLYRQPSGALAGIVFQIGCDMTSHTFDELCAKAREAPDAWERDAIAIWDPELCVPYVYDPWAPPALR